MHVDNDILEIKKNYLCPILKFEYLYSNSYYCSEFKFIYIADLQINLFQFVGG